MHAATLDANDGAPVPAWLGRTRIAIGLVQGVLLYLLYAAAKDKLWPASAPLLFAPLVLTAALVPVIVINGLGHMTRRQLILWAGVALVISTALGLYDAWRNLGLNLARGGTPSGPLAVCLTAGLFIGHALVLAGARERRRIASYASYFDLAWKLGLQIAFCGLFVGVTWLVLQLGAALFALVKLNLLQKVIAESWFAIPVTAFAFASAMHLTDVKPGIVRGIRNLVHVLLSWILPVLVLLVAGFLLSLPFTGLAPLWATRSAAAILLTAAGAFVVLINAAWQDGAAPAARPVALAARVAALLLAPLTLLAGYALALRVIDHGWTVDRIIAAACLVVAACYAGGYAAAALRRGWLPTLAGVNISAAFVVLAVLALLFSPLLDPARLSVNSQMARLEAGRITLRQLDVAYLHHDGARYGRAALATLEARTRDKEDALWLGQQLARLRAARPDVDDASVKAADNLRVWPAGARLPAGFADTVWAGHRQRYALPRCLRQRGMLCDAFVIDLGGDATPEVIVVDIADGRNAVLRRGGDGWELAGSSRSLLDCQALVQAMRDGKIRALAPRIADLDVNGQRVEIRSEIRSEMQSADCPIGPGIAAPLP